MCAARAGVGRQVPACGGAWRARAGGTRGCGGRLTRTTPQGLLAGGLLLSLAFLYGIYRLVSMPLPTPRGAAARTKRD
jgi:hypothetical protein